MAEILKRYYPKYVDIQNYIPTCNTAKKIDNWCTLNRKVFSKLNIKLSMNIISKLAQSKPGYIEKILLDLRTKIINDYDIERNSLLDGCEDSLSQGKSIFSYSLKGIILINFIGCFIEFPKTIKNPEESLNQTIPRKAFVKLKKELEEKTITINLLLKKIEHLETMLKFKEQQIEDLTVQIHSTTAKA